MLEIKCKLQGSQVSSIPVPAQYGQAEHLHCSVCCKPWWGLAIEGMHRQEKQMRGMKVCGRIMKRIYCLESLVIRYSLVRLMFAARCATAVPHTMAWQAAVSFGLVDDEAESRFRSTSQRPH
jgi:hypothetical protein